MQKFATFCLALAAGALSLLPIAARAELPGPQLVAVGKKLGWTAEQTAAIDSVIGTYSSALDDSLYKQAMLQDPKPRELLADAAKAQADYRAGVEKVLGADGFKAYLAEEQQALIYMHSKAVAKALGGQRVPLKLTLDQIKVIAPSLVKARFQTWTVVLKEAGNPTISAHGMSAMANLIDRIQYGTDQTVSKALDKWQWAEYKKKRDQGEEMAAILRGKRNEGYQDDLAVITNMFNAGRPLGRWKEGLMFDGIVPTEGLKSGANWLPGAEEVRPGEMRVTLMGTAPRLPRPGQLGASVYVELGNGDKFIFDFGEGALINYLAGGVPFNRINDIFLTNLEWSNFASVPYMYVFGAWAGRWQEPFRVTGPSGRTPELGLKRMLKEMDEMLTWHKTSFDLSPIGKGFDLEVNEFDFRDDGGVVYNKNGVKITHWRQSHIADGATAYRLDWNGLCMVYTGNGRPNSLTTKYAQGCDLLITGIHPEIVPVSSVANGTLPIIARAGLDMGGNPAYAAGYLYNQVKPRLAIGTHVDYDAYSFEEIVAEVRENWKGPFHVGAPDMMVVNMDKDWIWVRDGVLPAFPSTRPPKFDNTANPGMVIPEPRGTRPEVQEQFIRDAQIPPEEYYPPAYFPQLLEVWPTDKPIYAPWFMMDDKMLVKPLEEKKQ